jgi:hypothetical protein
MRITVFSFIERQGAGLTPVGIGPRMPVASAQFYPMHGLPTRAGKLCTSCLSMTPEPCLCLIDHVTSPSKCAHRRDNLKQITCRGLLL